MHRWSISLYRIAGLLSIASSPLAAQAGRTGTLVVSNMNDNTATVLDVASGRVLATVPTGEGPHEVAMSHDGRWALVSNYGVRGKPGSTITVIDVARATVSRTIDLHDYQRPHGMAFLPGDSLVAVTSETSRAILLLDFKNDKVLSALPTGGRGGHMIGLAADGRRLVTGIISDGAIGVLAMPGGGEPKVIPVARQPEGVAISPDGMTAWAGSNRDSVVLVVNTSTGAADTLRGFGLPYHRRLARRTSRGDHRPDEGHRARVRCEEPSRAAHDRHSARQPRGYGGGAGIAVAGSALRSRSTWAAGHS